MLLALHLSFCCCCTNLLYLFLLFLFNVFILVITTARITILFALLIVDFFIARHHLVHVAFHKRIHRLFMLPS